MNRWMFMGLHLAFFGGVPLFLAAMQDVPTHNDYQRLVLAVSLAGFGLLLGLFWLSRLFARDAGVRMRFSSMLSWHKYIGYFAGLVMLLHPVLMIARRFRAVESNPVDNLLLMLQSPLVLPGIIAWCLLVGIVTLAFCRKRFRYTTFRAIHGVLSLGFVGCATWHVLKIGRHSNAAMSGFWIMLAVTAGAILLKANLPALRKIPFHVSKGELKGELHETA